MNETNRLCVDKKRTPMVFIKCNPRKFQHALVVEDIDKKTRKVVRNMHIEIYIEDCRKMKKNCLTLCSKIKGYYKNWI